MPPFTEGLSSPISPPATLPTEVQDKWDTSLMLVESKSELTSSSLDQVPAPHTQVTNTQSLPTSRPSTSDTPKPQEYYDRKCANKKRAQDALPEQEVLERRKRHAVAKKAWMKRHHHKKCIMAVLASQPSEMERKVNDGKEWNHVVASAATAMEWVLFMAVLVDVASMPHACHLWNSLITRLYSWEQPYSHSQSGCFTSLNIRGLKAILSSDSYPLDHRACASRFVVTALNRERQGKQ
ncbi:hypothetical protein HETIRDRAFT_431174 [Heterobasidion irregulare TC 32-1]|uniref:Uncharacterized protein n=1 Tax=Heterobasidion irregulare (strain TC 32-1) TaxID=747525 RepID=W4JPL0_HETIT|nr:uncharacterized protein HETIRDRAFT_431174 [Heterobasidion irregulare TC 32-1]ETW75025.1 hypothetical protein HETIRDRAFT_431174 [Heterobasidion irregulare TC 32-1]